MKNDPLIPEIKDTLQYRDMKSGGSRSKNQRFGGCDMISILIPNAKEENIIELLNEIDKLFPKAQVIIATDRDRRGKGWAVREALSQATGDIICFLDGDGDIHPAMIKRLLPHINEFDIVCGKKDAGSRIDRKILTILSRLYIWVMFRIPVDTQTGIKLFRRDALPEWKENGFSFDIEILAKAQKAGARMYNLGIEAKCERKMKLTSIWATLKGSFRIWWDIVGDQILGCKQK